MRPLILIDQHSQQWPKKWHRSCHTEQQPEPQLKLPKQNMAANGTVSLPAPSAAGYAADTAFEASFRETLAGLN